MPFRARLVATVAFASAGFLLVPAVAQAASHPVQVTGNKLQSALLPASAFGSGFEFDFAGNSGRSLLHQPAKDRVASMSCGNFEDGVGFGRFGQSSAAFSFVENQDAITNFPNAEFYFNQVIYQFPTAKAATTYYGQAKAKYAKCRDFTESVPGNSVPGSGGLETTLLSMSKTNVGSYQAFQLTQAVTVSEVPGFALTFNTTVTVEGTDVFSVVSLSGTNDPVPASTMLKLVNRVKKLR